MKNFKIYGSLFLAMLSCFDLGVYASSIFRYNEPIEPHRWILITLLGLIFLFNFLEEFKKK